MAKGFRECIGCFLWSLRFIFPWFLPSVLSPCDCLGVPRISSPLSPPALAMPMLPSPLVKDNGAKLVVPRWKIYTSHLLTAIFGTEFRSYASKFKGMKTVHCNFCSIHCFGHILPSGLNFLHEKYLYLLLS